MDAHNNLGVIFTEIGDYSAAIENYKRAIEANPNNIIGHSNLGVVLSKLDQHENAIVSFKNALSMVPNAYDVMLNLGVSQYLSGDIHEAIKSMLEVIDNNSNNSSAWRNLYYSITANSYPHSDRVNKVIDTTMKKSLAGAILNYKISHLMGIKDFSLGRLYNSFSKFDKNLIQNPSKVSTRNQKNPSYEYKNICTLIHFGRSGSGLLHSLIDGHSNVSTVPSVYFSEFFNTERWSKLVSKGWLSIGEEFVKNYEIFFDSESNMPVFGPTGDKVTRFGIKEGLTSLGQQRSEKILLDKEKFLVILEELIKSLQKLNTSEFFQLIHRAYDRILGKRNDVDLLFYHIHNPSINARANFHRLTPNAKWLLLVREPIQSCESWLKVPFSSGSLRFSCLSNCLNVI